ncbi:ditrans,polycis-undecaprenyl-diphosphate synthase ((2E,6E)-farnesyl-diphosphate specific) [Desulfovibrionales bacterium]
MLDALPGHIAIIMDGNGRWAKARGLPRSAGHRAGTQAAKAIVTACRERGVQCLSLYAFSRENWARPKDEVTFLFDLLIEFLCDELQNLLDQSIRFKILGSWKEFPFTVRQVLKHVCARTAQGQSMTLNLAINYSGREEIIIACREAIRQSIDPADLTEERFKELLFTAGQPDPDLVIRTSGELRLSNYLLFQVAYAELYFTSTFWPDFTPDALAFALADYAKRQRRFGLIGDQVNQ